MPLPFAPSPSQTLLQAAAEQELRRPREIQERWRYYQGDFDPTLKVEAGDPDDNVRVNLTGTIVDAGIDFLFGEDLQLELSGEGGRGTDTTREHRLTEQWGRMMTTLQKLGLNGAVSGHAILKITVAEGQSPRLVVIDPANYQALWDEDDIDHVVEHRITWTVIRDKKPVTKRQRWINHGDHWEWVDEESRGDNTTWTTIDGGPWNYEWAPISQCQNLIAPNEFYGRPDLTRDITDANQAINSVLSDLKRTVRLHGHPLYWLSGATGEALDVGPGDAIELPEGAQVGAIETRSDPTALELYERLKAALHEQARVPEITGGKLEGIGQLSGLALQILYGPLVRKTRTKRRLYGDLIREVSAHLQELDGNDPLPVLIHWPDPLPTDEKAEAETAILDHQVGASRQTLLERRGFNSQDELARREEEDLRDQETAARAFDGGAGL